MVEATISNEKLLRNLEAIGNKIPSSVEKALFRSGLIIEAKAKNLAPVDTGRLRADIVTVKVSKTTVKVGTNVKYGKFQEFGTVFQSGTPFLRPAIRISLRKIERLFSSVLKRDINIVVRR